MKPSSTPIPSNRFAGGLSVILRPAMAVSLALVVAFLATSPAYAEMVGLQISGTVGQGPPGTWPQDSPFTASYMFDTSTAPYFNSFDSHTYYIGAVKSFVFSVGSFNLGGNAGTIRVADGLSDFYRVELSFDAATLPAGYEWGAVSLQYSGPSNILSSTALPTDAAALQLLLDASRTGTTVYPSLGSGGTGYPAYGYSSTITAVPEPSTYAMALAGIACGGLSMWRRRKHQRVGRSFITTASLALVAACFANGSVHAVTIEWSTIVSSTGNAPDPATGGVYGRVDHEYQIAKHAVTIQQYTDFLNAVAATDPYSLYNPSMGTDLNIAGISRSGSSGSYTYSVINNGGPSGNRPITYVSWFDAARFANWMQNGQGAGSTETGAYTLADSLASGQAPGKNAGAQFYIPTENEWYKAAYYSPALNSGSGGYYTYATQSNTAPGNTIGSASNQANYYAGDVFSVTQSSTYDLNRNYLTDVGAFTNSTSFYGTFDQSGNVYQWNDLDGTVASARGLRGGYWFNGVLSVSSSERMLFDPSFDSVVFGIRLATVPEPTTWAMGAAGIACAGWRGWRRRKHQRVGRSFITAASLALVAACLATSPAHAAPITIDMVTVGNPGNANDPATGNLYGAVNYEYQIGKYEVTIGQYTQFLNAVDPSGTNPYGLYSDSMGSEGNVRGIVFSSGSASGQKYSPMGSPNRPITYVSWFDAARFANWMQNGQGSGSTETGAYTLVDGQTNGTAPARNPGATFYIPMENEWYKAAYFSPVLNSASGGYYTYATQSNTDPGNNIGSGANQANYYASYYAVTQSSTYNFSQNYLTDVGAFPNSASYYGTFDQSGNVWEWNDLTGASGLSRGVRGGNWANDASNLSSSLRITPAPSQEDNFGLGFRLASSVAVPEPSTYAMALAGLACGGFSMWRRRSRTNVRSESQLAPRWHRAHGVWVILMAAPLSVSLCRPCFGEVVLTVDLLTNTISGSDSIKGMHSWAESTTNLRNLSVEKVWWEENPGQWSVVRRVNNDYVGFNDTSLQMSYLSDAMPSPTVVDTEWQTGYGVGVSLRQTLIYTPFVSAVRPFPEIGNDLQYIYHIGRVTAGTTYSNANFAYESQVQFSASSPEPMSRIFVALNGAPVPSGQLVVYDSGELGGVGTASSTFNLDYSSGTQQSFSAQYDVYAVVPVPEPSAYAMSLAGIACGGYSIWRRRKHQRVGRSFIIAASLALVAACLANGPLLANPITIDWVTVGNQGNANDTTGYGAVNYEYRIGKYEVTIQQYTDFLNAVAATDTYLLYNTSMASNLLIAGISRSGTGGGYTYSVIGSSGNKPITYVSWFDAARFANWMQNGQGSGSTETGAYTLGGATSGNAVAVNPGATFYIPTENEWYKAAYYSPVLNSGSGGYYTYAMQSNTVPGNVVGGAANQANYFNGVYSVTQSGNYSTSQNYLSDAGAFSNSASYYGTFDQSGNVFEWNDRTGAAGPTRALRGGTWGNNAFDLSSSSRYDGYAPATDGQDIGFRLAAVPEPTTYAMALAGLACGGFSMWRRRRVGLTRVSQHEFNARGAGRHHGPVHLSVFTPASIRPHDSPHPTATRPFRPRMPSTPRLLHSGFICGMFSLVLFGSASSQAEIVFSDKLVSGRLSGLTGGSSGGIWDNEPVDESYGPSESFSGVGSGHFGRGYGIEAFFSGLPTMIYSPFVNVERPFPEIGTDMQYVYKMGTLNFAAYQHFPGGTWTWEFNGSYTIASDEPMSRVFVTVFGAPTPSGETVVRDSGELGGAFSNSGSYDLTLQTADILYNGSWQVAEYGIYAVVPVPEPCTYAMALAGIACGGFSMWRRRKHQRVGRSFITTASLALAAECLAISPAHAVPVTVPAAAATTSGSSGWGFGYNGSQQVVQNLFPSGELAGLNPGDTILGLTIRAEGFPFPGRFDSPYTFPRFDIAIGPGISSLTTAFTNNFTSPSTTVRTGSLTVGQGFFQGPLAFGSMIAFDTPYTYGGGNLLIEMRTISAQVGFTADLMEAAQTSGQLAYAFGNANAITASSVSQYNFAMQLDVVPVPEPTTWAMGAAGIACAGWRGWRRRKHQRVGRSFITAASLALVAACLATSPASAVSLAKGTLGNALRSLATAALVALVSVSSAMTAPRAQGDVVTFNFTASDFLGHSGTGSFSYDSSMPGFAISPTFSDYSPFAPPSVFSPVTINFTSQVGTFSASNLFSHVYVRNDDATWGDKVDINIDTTDSGSTKVNSIIFRNSASAAFGSTALPLDYSTAQFPNQRTLTYWDTAIGGYRYFYIDSVAAVPEPSTYAMALAGLACSGFSMWRRRKRA